MTREELEKRLAEIPVVEPDEWDLAMIKEAAEENDGTSITLEDFRAKMATRNGRLTLRIPKSLHNLLADGAEADGVSLNQYVVYQLARVVGHTTQP